MNKKVIIPLVIGACIAFSPVNVKAEDYYKWNMKVTGEKNKIWTVKFSKKLNNDLRNLEDKIYIKDSEGNKLNCRVNLKDDKKTLEVLPPNTGYNLDKTYYLYIDKEISSERKERLEDSIKMDFYIDKKVTFKDENLERIIREDLNKPSGDIFIKDISKAKIVYLDASNKDIKDLSGIEYLTDLKKLKLNDNKIDDISKISDLKSLKYLDLKNNNIKDFKALKDSTKLETLYLKGNKTEDYNPIEGYYYKIKDKDFSLYDDVKIKFEDKNLEKEVRKAAIEYGKDKDRPIGDLYNLKYTDVQGIKKLDLHNKGIKSIKGLEYLQDLEELDLSNNELSNIDTLKEFSKLKKVDLSKNKIKDISVFHKLNNVEYLNLSENAIEDISPLRNLKNINYLDLRHNKVYYIDSLKNKYNLEHLFLAQNNIIDFSPLATLNHLKDLYISNNISDDFNYTKEYYHNIINKDFTLNNPIVFEDKDFENLVRKEINKPSNPIYEKDMENIKKLDLYHAHIHKIGGIESFKSLESLNLKGTDIDDVSPLKALKNLKDVNLSNTKVKDISPLKNSTSIKILNINETNVSNIQSAEFMKSLEKLYLVNTKITSIKPITNLNKITELDISKCDIEFNDEYKNSIKSLNNLTKLNISNNPKVDDCSFIKDLTNLVYLDMKNTNINNIDNLGNLSKLEYLNISNTKVTNTKIIKNFPKLRKIDTTGCNINNGELDKDHNKLVVFQDKVLEKEIRDLIDKPSESIYEKDLLGITKLELSNRHIKNIEGLDSLRNLTYLDLSDNEIIDIKPIGAINKLDKLIIHNNKVESIKPLEDLNNLKELDLSNNNIGEITILYNLTSLERLDLSNNNIVNIKSLASLINLKYLSLYNNKVQEGIEDGLSRLYNLTEMYLKNSGIANFNATGAYYNNLAKKDFTIPEDFIVFEDKNKSDFAKIIRSVIGKKEDTNVYKSDLDKITELDLSKNELQRIDNALRSKLNSKVISDLEGIQYLSNLTSLKISGDGNRLGNISNLIPLKKLIKLDMENINVEGDLTKIKYLTNLEYLKLNNMGIRDIEFISYLTKLKELDLSKNQLKNLNPIGDLNKLNKLYVVNNNIYNVEALEKLINLNTLDLIDNNNLDNIYPLKSLINLKSLNLPSSVKDYTPTTKYYYNLIYKNFELKNNNVVVIKNIKDIDKEVNKGDKFSLPNYVQGVMSDNSKEDFKVNWDKKDVDTSKEGVYIFTGNVDGYGKKVKLTLTVNGYIPEGMGNSLGNIINGALTAKDDNYIYYINKEYDNKIYKNKINGAEDSLLSTDNAKYLNCYGNYIYYISSGNICRIKKDGGSVEKILNCDASNMIIYNNWIYFFDKSKPGIYKIKTDKTGYEAIISGGQWRIDSEFVLSGDNIYYGNYSDGNCIYKIKIDGSGKVKLNNIESKHMIIVGKWIYYVSNGNIYKMKTDGSLNTLLYKGNVVTLNVDDSYVYYTDGNKDNFLYRIDINGDNNTLILKKSVTFLNILGNNIYYISNNEPNKLKTINK
ncbi:leucine-rich repeat domain-containing protein [Clostridium niameyense]|uniref:leucine-rich repeat domain-containing protein n=1 Tax=Clostridium niameyense TaxID=1622073 RepID=UPI00067F6E26|nr:leucine-rich repeat domain-containing protein [Clostridium niameyense]